MSRNSYLPDMVALIGTLDLVFGAWPWPSCRFRLKASRADRSNAFRAPSNLRRGRPLRWRRDALASIFSRRFSSCTYHDRLAIRSGKVGARRRALRREGKEASPDVLKRPERLGGERERPRSSVD